MLLHGLFDEILNIVFNACPMQSIELDAARIRELGGPSKVATLLEMRKPGSAQRVQNWLKRGIPAAVKLQRPDLFAPELVAAHAAPTQEASRG